MADRRLSTALRGAARRLLGVAWPDRLFVGMMILLYGGCAVLAALAFANAGQILEVTHG